MCPWLVRMLVTCDLLYTGSCHPGLWLVKLSSMVVCVCAVCVCNNKQKKQWVFVLCSREIRGWGITRRGAFVRCVSHSKQVRAALSTQAHSWTVWEHEWWMFPRFIFWEVSTVRTRRHSMLSLGAMCVVVRLGCQVGSDYADGRIVASCSFPGFGWLVSNVGVESCR